MQRVVEQGVVRGTTLKGEALVPLPLRLASWATEVSTNGAVIVSRLLSGTISMFAPAVINTLSVIPFRLFTT
jgi:hypothetical protein